MGVKNAKANNNVRLKIKYIYFKSLVYCYDFKQIHGSRFRLCKDFPPST